MIMGLVPNWLAPHNKIAEQDFAGTIVSISPPLPNLPQAQKLDIGQKVYGFCAQSPLKPQGALAQYIAVDARLVAPIPAKLSFEEAAGLGTVGITAVASLGDAKVQDGQNIFIVGGTLHSDPFWRRRRLQLIRVFALCYLGSTSIGIFAIQALKIKHCTVTVSCSAKNAELVMKLGADRVRVLLPCLSSYWFNFLSTSQVIDYTKGPVFAQLEAEAEHKQPYDVIIDCMGDMDLWRHSPSYLREGGYFSAPGTGFRKWSDVPRLVPAVLSAYLRPAWLGGVGGGRTFR